MKYSIVRFLVLLMSLFLLSGCADNKMFFRYVAEPQKEIVWPKGEEIPRYKYVGLLTGEDNFYSVTEDGVGASVITALKWIAGVFSDNSHIPRVLQRPQAGFVGDDGRIYVTDVSRQAVYVFDTVQGKMEIWTDAGTTGGFLTPVGISPGKNGEVLVADADHGSVIRLDASGKPVGFFGGGALERPTGVAYSPEKEWVYVADSGAHNIKVFADDGSFVKVIGKRGDLEGEFNGPTHMSYVREKLYVTDSLNSRVQVFTADGEFIRVFGHRGVYVGDLPRPKGVALDSEDNVYVIESYYDHLLVFNDKGQFLLPIGGTGQGIGQFYLPSGVWTDDKDHIYVSDMFNGRIVIFQYLGASPNISSELSKPIAPIPHNP